MSDLKQHQPTQTATAGSPRPVGGGGKTLAGSLRSFNLFEVLQFLRLGSMTGVLTVSRESDDLKLMIRQGKIVNSSIFTHRQRLGEMLLVRGIVGRREIDDILMAQRDGTIDGPLGQVLVDRGVLSQETLSQTLRLQLEEEIWAILNWPDGEFHFEPHETLAETAPSVIELEIEPLILEESRRQDEWEMISEVIPGDNIVPRPTPPENFHECDRSLTLNEWRLLAQINGVLSVGALVQRSGIGRFETYRVLANFVRQGWVQCVPALRAEQDFAEDDALTDDNGSNGRGKSTTLKRKRQPKVGESDLAKRSHVSLIGLAAALANALMAHAEERGLAQGVTYLPLTWKSWQELMGRYPAADVMLVKHGRLSASRFDRYWTSIDNPVTRTRLADEVWGAISELIIMVGDLLIDGLPQREWDKISSQIIGDIRAARIETEPPPGIAAADLVTLVERASDEEVPGNGR